MTEWERDAARHCETGLAHLWRGEVEEALAAYDRGLALETSDETRDLLTIRKAEALIAGERDGAEIAALAGIVMRRSALCRCSRDIFGGCSRSSI